MKLSSQVLVMTFGACVFVGCNDSTSGNGGGGGEAASTKTTSATKASVASSVTATQAATSAVTNTATTNATTASSTSSGMDASPVCKQYCEEFLPNCNTIPMVEAYDDEADCLTTCAGFMHGPVGEFTGDTVECRVAHLIFNPNPGAGYYELHCFHAQEHPTSQCK